MEINGLWGGFYRLSIWVTRLAYINLLWILFTLVGLVAFGFMPATIAIFTVIRKWLIDDPDVPIFKTFFQTYKKEFVKSNLFGLVIMAIGYILYIDLQFIGTVTNSVLYPILLAILFIVGLFYLFFILYIGPVYVHYQLSFVQYIKYAIMFGFTYLHYTIFMLILLALIYWGSMTFPGIVPFFSVGGSAFVIMWSANMAFNQLLIKKEKLEEAEESL